MKKDNTLLEMLVGIIVWGLLVQIVLLLAFKDYLYNAIGLWCGIAVAGGMAIHMKRSIEDALDLGGPFVKKRMQSDAAKRMGMAAIIIGIVFYLGVGNPLTVLAGIFSLKISAYTQPYMHKVFQKIQKSK